MRLEPGRPCKHPGCLAHVSHPCEGCGRIAGMPTKEMLTDFPTTSIMFEGLLPDRTTLPGEPFEKTL